MNPTTDPSLRSWLSVSADSPFPIQNLPYGVFRRHGEVHQGVAIGDAILDLTVLASQGLFPEPVFQGLFHPGDLAPLLPRGPTTWRPLRQKISQLLRADEPLLRENARLREMALVRPSEVTMQLPARVGDYTDFYSSREHATNVGSMFRDPANALLPNWLYLPVAYHGRSSSVVISGTPIRRPRGQYKPGEASEPIFGPTRSLDYELEMAAVVGPGNDLGTSIPPGEAEDHVLGMVLLNDWSARDIQGWEYQPLGPFLGKNFATSISPWVVTLEALEPFRCPGPVQEPPPLAYLQQEGKTSHDIHLEVYLRPGSSTDAVCICQSNFKYLYWSLRQQIAHHTINGCPLRPGDLLATGTISGPDPESRGCLLERTWKGTRPLALPQGQTRRFLEDGDEVTLTGWCQGAGYRIGFGSVTGTILPARG